MDRNLHPRQSTKTGQHFLKKASYAAGLVESAQVSQRDLVLEIGAGKGRLTEQLIKRAGRIIAVESDPRLAIHLIDRFMARSNLMVVCADVLAMPLPREAFRVLGNIPFGITTELLRKLMDADDLERADLVVQWGAAKKRAQPRHSHAQNVAWGPWWTFRLVERIPAFQFTPPPSVDAALLSIRRRTRPLLPWTTRRDFERFVRKAFLLGRVDARNPTVIPLDDWVSLFIRHISGKRGNHR